MSSMIRWITAEIRYRREKRMLACDPYGYIRFALGLPSDMTDAEIDEGFQRTGEAIREAGVSAAAAGEALAAVIKAAGDLDTIALD